MRNRIKAKLTQIGSSGPGRDDHRRFNDVTQYCDSVEEALVWLEHDYDIVPARRPKGVYVDGKDGCAVQVGFMHFRWNRDGSGRAYWEENWITFYESYSEPAVLPDRLRVK